MNEEVLRLGLARTAPVAGVLPDSRLYWRLHRRLHRAEVKAERKGQGGRRTPCGRELPKLSGTTLYSDS